MVTCNVICLISPVQGESWTPPRALKKKKPASSKHISTHAYCDSPDIVLCGNKCDVTERRIISEQRAREAASEYGLPYLETSAATGQNVSACIELLLDLVMQRIEVAVDKALTPLPKSKNADKITLRENVLRKKCSC